MTKKHYEAIAKIIEQHNVSLENGWHYNLEDALSDYFAQDNPRFDRERFLKACGIGTCNNKDTNGNACFDCESMNGYSCGSTELIAD